MQCDMIKQLVVVFPDFVEFTFIIMLDMSDNNFIYLQLVNTAFLVRMHLCCDYIDV